MAANRAAGCALTGNCGDRCRMRRSAIGLALSWRKGPEERSWSFCDPRGGLCSQSAPRLGLSPSVIGNRHELSGSSASASTSLRLSIEALAMVISGGGVSGGTYKSVSDGGLELIRV